MAGRQCGKIAIIAAAEDRGDGDTGRKAGLEHDSVTFGNSAIAQAQSPQAIANVRIDASVVEDELRSHAAQQVWQQILQYRKIAAVLGTGIKRNIQITLLLAGRIVAATMHREGEDLWLIGQDRCRPVSLMDVEVNDENAPHPSFGQKG